MDTEDRRNLKLVDQVAGELSKGETDHKMNHRSQCMRSYKRDTLPVCSRVRNTTYYSRRIHKDSLGIQHSNNSIYD